jgi:hypothetical protein
MNPLSPAANEAVVQLHLVAAAPLAESVERARRRERAHRQLRGPSWVEPDRGAQSA